MANKTPSINANDLLQQAKNLLEQNQFTEQVVLLLQEAAQKFEAQKNWKSYLQTHIQWAVFYIKTSKFKLAEELLTQAMTKTRPHLSKDTIEVGDAFNQLATSAYYQANHPLAQHYFEKALGIYQTNYGEKHIDTARTYSNLGNCSYTQNRIGTALSYYQKSLEIREEILPHNHPHFAFSYSALARCYSVNRNYKKALLYFQQALNIRIGHYGANHLMVSYSYSDISACYLNLLNETKARENDLKALAIKEKVYPNGHPTIASSYSKIADTYFKEDKLKEALSYYQKAAQMQLEFLGTQHPHLADSYAQIGRCFLKIHLPESFDYLQKALAIYQNIYGDYHKKTATALDYLGRFYEEQEEYAQALYYYQKVIYCVCEIQLQDFEEQDIYQIPPIHQYSSIVRLLKVIAFKAAIFFKLHQQNQSLQDIQAAFDHYTQLIQLAAKVRKLQSSEAEHLFFSEEVASIYEQAIETALTLYKHTNKATILEQAFVFAEKGKAIVLLNSLQKNEAKISSEIPSDLLQKLKELEAALSNLDTQLKTAKDTALQQQIQKELFQTTRQYETLTDQLESDYPEYYQLKYDVKIVGIKDLQQALKNIHSQTPLQPKPLLLSYYLGENQLFIFEITADSYQVHTQASPIDLEDQILDFQDAISLMDIDDYIEAASDLYDLLLAPVLDKRGLPTVIPQKLIVLRHDLLDYLPFETLLKAKGGIEYTSFAALPYLIHHYEVSYHYSTTLLIKKIRQSQTTSTRHPSFLGLAPIDFNGETALELEIESRQGSSKVLRSSQMGENTLQNLPNTETEVKEVYQLFQEKSLDAKALLYASASKENLIKEASKHKFLLISTHGFVEDEETGLSGIYLSAASQQIQKTQTAKHKPQNPKTHKSSTPQAHKPSNTQTQLSIQTPEHINSQTPKHNLLYTSDTYHLDLQSDLVVLSSCSSGIGKLQKGEGLMAINRGFLYAGASNIIFTQFDIPDQSSSQLVKKLFEYILEGDGYSTALRKAKLHLIQEESSSVQDWGAYLLIGV